METSFFTSLEEGVEIGKNSDKELGSGGGSVGREGDSNTKELRFEFRRWQNFIYQWYNRKYKNKEKEAGNGPS